MGSLDWSILWRAPYSEQIGAALRMTVEIAFAAWVLGVFMGILVGLARDAPLVQVRLVATAHVEIFRNIPPLVQLFFIYFVLPRVLPMPIRRVLFEFGWGEAAAIIALSLYSSAKISEHVRAGLNAAGRQLQQAALATGLTWWQGQRLVVLPLVLRIIAPGLTSEFVTIFKGSSLAMTVGVAEIYYVTQELGVETFRWVEAGVFGTSVYLLCAWVIAGVMALVERWTRVPGLMRREVGQ
jgi:glutamate/aspartate transport system permease protein